MPTKCPHCLTPEPELNNGKQVYQCSICGKTWPLGNPDPPLPAQAKAGPTRIFLSYARGDDEPFVHRLREDLLKAGFKVWLDRHSLRSRGNPFPQEIKDAIRTETDRLIYIGGPRALVSDYVQAEWKFALECDHVVVIPILRLGDYEGSAIPGELSLLHCEDFRENGKYKATLSRLIDNLRQPNPPLGGLLSVPSLPPGFISRPELMRRVRDALLVDLQKPQVITGDETRFGIQGMGGIGKSVLAAALARNREVRQTYPDGIVWVSFAQNLKNEDLLSRQREVISYLGGDTTYDTLSLGRERLRLLMQDKALLLILDNVWQAKDVTQTFDVMGPRCRLLITTRDAGILQALKGEPLPVSLFSETEALQLLSTINNLPVKELPAEAIEVAKECGYLPLALALCASMAKKQGGDFSAVLTRLRRAALDKIEDRAAINEQHRSIWRAMQASVEMLDPEKQKRFAELAAFYPDRPLSEAAIATLWAYTAELDELDSKDLLIELVERSLVQRSEIDTASDNLKRSFSLHDLLYDYAAVMTPDRQALNKSLVEAYRKKTGNRFFEGPNDGYFFESLCHHLVDLEDWILLIGDEDNPGLLTDLRFIQAKCEAGLVYDLVKDYNLALKELPEFREEQEYLREHEKAMRAYNKALNDYAVKRYDYLHLREQGLKCDEPLYPELPEILKDDKRPPLPEESSARAALLRHFANFVSRCLAVLAAHPEEIFPVAYNDSSEGPVSAQAEQLLKSYNKPWLRRSPRPPVYPLRPQCLRTMEGHNWCVESVSVSPDGKFAVSGSSDETLRVWDLETGACLQVLEGHRNSVYSVSISFDGRFAVSASSDETLRVWDLETGACLQVLEGHKNSVYSVSISFDGRFAVSGSRDETLRVWNLKTGACLKALKGHEDRVYSVSITPDGRFAVSGSRDKTLMVWDLATGACLQVLKGHNGWVSSVSITPDGRFAVSGSKDKTLMVWDLETGACLQVLKGHNGRVRSVSIAPDGRFAVSGSRDKTLMVWDLATGACLQVLKGHNGRVRSVSIAPDGRFAVSGSFDNTMRIWDLGSGVCLQALEGHSSRVRSVSIAPDGRFAVSGSFDNIMRAWDLRSGTCLQLLEEHCGWISSVSIAPDSRFAISGSSDENLRVWDLENSACLQVLKGHKGSVTSINISDDGRFAVSGSSDKTLRVWDLETGACLQVIKGHDRRVRSVSITPDGRFAVSGSSDKTLRVWDLATGACLQILEGHNGWVSSVSITPDGRFAVSGSKDKTLMVWDLETGACLQVLEEHNGWVSSVSITPDGRFAVSGSRDGSLRVWDLEIGSCHLMHNAGTRIEYVSVSPTGDHIVCGAADGQMHFLTPVNFPPNGPAIITTVRLWLFGDANASGRWDDNLTALCPWCGKRFTVSAEMPGKQITCPFKDCGQPIILNPFIVDGKV